MYLRTIIWDITHFCAIQILKTEENNLVENKKSISTLLLWLWRNSKGARLQATLNTFAGTLDVVCQLLWVLACKRAIDIATGEATGSLLAVGITIASLMLVEIGSRAAGRWINAILGVRACNSLRLDIFSRLMRSEWLYMQKHHTGDLINRLEGDVANITQLITATIPAVAVVVLQLVGSFVLLYSMNSMLAVAVLFILPICLVISRIYVKYMREYNRQVRESDSRIQSVLQESLQHKAIIKTLEQNNATEKQLTQLQDKLHSQVRNRAKFSIGAFTFIQFGFASGYLTAFMWGVYGLSTGSVTFGALSAFLQLVGLIQRPTMDLSRYLPSMVSALTAAERLNEIEDIPEEEQGERIMLDGTAGVRFENVTFGYEEEGGNILEDFNYDFTPNSSTAIVGETGAGKTTLIRLLVALVHPQGGSIRLYNHKESYSSSPLTRGNFVYIPQGNSLISGTIRDNLLMGNPSATEEEIHQALYTACAEYVHSLPQGIDTNLSEQGGGLSEGQAQRIAIARSLLRPGSILILDEITSALDNETEEELLRRLTTSNTGKTLIFVTHRPAVLKYCNNILKIGKTAEQ